MVTRLDLAYAPRSTHWVALIRILHYLRDTIFQGMLLSSTSPLELVAYADANWAGDVTDRKKQTAIARSTADAEYCAMAHATAKIRRSLLNEDEYGFRRARRPIYYDEGLEKTRQTLNAKISQLNSAIDNVSSRLRGGNNMPAVPIASDPEEATM
ncbi:hypothetical protein CsSME_00029549 [Camellia sinensis var. sinensis]